MTGLPFTVHKSLAPAPTGTRNGSPRSPARPRASPVGRRTRCDRTVGRQVERPVTPQEQASTTRPPGHRREVAATVTSYPPRGRRWSPGSGIPGPEPFALRHTAPPLPAAAAHLATKPGFPATAAIGAAIAGLFDQGGTAAVGARIRATPADLLDRAQRAAPTSCWTDSAPRARRRRPLPPARPRPRSRPPRPRSGRPDHHPSRRVDPTVSPRLHSGRCGRPACRGTAHPHSPHNPLSPGADMSHQLSRRRLLQLAATSTAGLGPTASGGNGSGSGATGGDGDSGRITVWSARPQEARHLPGPGLGRRVPGHQVPRGRLGRALPRRSAHAHRPRPPDRPGLRERPARPDRIPDTSLSAPQASPSAGTSPSSASTTSRSARCSSPPSPARPCPGSHRPRPRRPADHRRRGPRCRPASGLLLPAEPVVRDSTPRW
jgi:hypothetical protein